MTHRSDLGQKVVDCVYHTRKYHILTEDGTLYHIPKYFHGSQGFTDIVNYPHGGRIAFAQALLDIHNDEAKIVFRQPEEV